MSISMSHSVSELLLHPGTSSPLIVCSRRPVTSMLNKDHDVRLDRSGHRTVNIPSDYPCLNIIYASLQQIARLITSVHEPELGLMQYLTSALGIERHSHLTLLEWSKERVCRILFRDKWQVFRIVPTSLHGRIRLHLDGERRIRTHHYQAKCPRLVSKLNDVFLV